jgi:hypothetical protein
MILPQAHPRAIEIPASEARSLAGAAMFSACESRWYHRPQTTLSKEILAFALCIFPSISLVQASFQRADVADTTTINVSTDFWMSGQWDLTQPPCRKSISSETGPCCKRLASRSRRLGEAVQCQHSMRFAQHCGICTCCTCWLFQRSRVSRVAPHCSRDFSAVCGRISMLVPKGISA